MLPSKPGARTNDRRPPGFADDPEVEASGSVLAKASSGSGRPILAIRALHPAAALVAWGLIGFAAFIVVSTIGFTILSHNAIPQADEWFSFEVYDAMRTDGRVLSHLFQQHNEHRILFPRLVLFSNYLFFGGCGLFDKAVILLVQVLETALFVWLIRQIGAGVAARRGLCAVVTVLLFSLYQCENFQWAFQVQFVGVFACASLCCTLFALGLSANGFGRRSAGLIAAAFLLALVATFSMANGILAGPVLVAMALVARARKWVTISAAAVSAALIVAFSIGYHIDDSR